MHDTSGAINGPGSTVAGVARRFRAYSTSGVIRGPGAAVTGVARHNFGHSTTGALNGPGSAVAGVARRTLSTLYPDPSQVLEGVVYGPGGIYTGTLVVTPGETSVAIRSFTRKF